MGRRRTGSAWEKPPGSGVWLAAITAGGKRHTQRVPARKSGAAVDERYAKAYASEWQRRADEGEWSPPSASSSGSPPGVAAPSADMTVGAWAERWAAGLTHWTTSDDRSAVRIHVATDPLAALRLRDVTLRDAVAFVERLRAKPAARGSGTLAPRSVLRYANTLARAFDRARLEGLIAASPFADLPTGVLPSLRDKTPGARRSWRFTREEIERLIAHPDIPEDRRVLWALAFLTGGRASELSALRWSDYDPTARPLGRLTIARATVRRDPARATKETKTGAVKEVPVHPTLAAILDAWKASGWERLRGAPPAPEDLLVPTWGGRPRDASDSWRGLQRDCLRAGIRRRKLHGTRHSLISLARDAGADRDSFRWITHASPARDAFGEYDSPSWARLCEAMLKVEVSPPGAQGSATDSATENPRPLAKPRRTSPALRQPSSWGSSTEDPKPAQNGADSSTHGTAVARPAAGTATDSATVPALHDGERAALAWLERVLLDAAE